MLFLVLIHATVTVYNENSELSTVFITSRDGRAEQNRIAGGLFTILCSANRGQTAPPLSALNASLFLFPLSLSLSVSE
jgi:hypothetical protein